jgi:hypothetical protein
MWITEKHNRTTKREYPGEYIPLSCPAAIDDNVWLSCFASDIQVKARSPDIKDYVYI